MIAKLTWKGKMVTLKDKERSILEMVAELDEENREAPEFQKVIRLAKNQLKEHERREVESKTRKLVESEYKRSKLEEDERLEKAKQDAALVAEKAKQDDEAKNQREPPSSSGISRKASATPPALKDFLTVDMQTARISLNRDPTGYGYRAFYPSSSQKIIHVEKLFAFKIYGTPSFMEHLGLKPWMLALQFFFESEFDFSFFEVCHFQDPVHHRVHLRGSIKKHKLVVGKSCSTLFSTCRDFIGSNSQACEISLDIS